MSLEYAIMEPLSLEFKILPEDYLEAVTLYSQRSKFRRYLVRTILILWVLIYFGHSAWGGRFASENPFSTALGFVFACVLLIPFSYATNWVRRRMMVVTFRREEVSKKTFCYNISEDKIHMVGPDSESLVKWTHFTSWSEGKTSFVLFQNRLMYVIPKRRLNPETEGQMRDLIVSKLGPK